jgi:para-aminobenzoate synthetase component 1
LNVVIRSLMYNGTNKALSFSVGSAITINANAEDEYNECLLKASGILKALGLHGVD